MPKEILKDKKRVFIVLALVVLLVLVRICENQLFYDPFLQFFKTEFHHQSLPEFNSVQLFVGLFFRYVLNMILSLGILYFMFKEKQIVTVSFWMYVLFFVVFSLLFFVLLHCNPDFMMLFYVRRFLIQPILLVLFIPAFYYQKFVK